MKRFVVLFLLFYSVNFLSAQENEKKQITIAPGAQYKTGWFHNLIFGKHWRELWATPISVEVLDLTRFADGLTPIEKGGGLQTKSLRFKGNDGNIWKFRSIDKDPSKILPPVLRQSIFSDVIQDQISSANPAAPLIVSPILEAVGILQAKPFLVYLPDDEKLGEFREEFRGLLGMIEIHPDVEEEERISFGDAEKVIGTFKLLHRLEDKRDEKVDSKEFLKARLVDVFLGDWDRHSDQWRWAKYKQHDFEIWKPIPRDRDQAFAKFDGWAVSIAEYLVPQLNHFGETYTQIEDITWSGRFLDRRFLTELTKSKWDSIAAFVYNRLTDDVFEDAIKQLPPEHYVLAYDELITKLKSRKNKFMEMSDEYYGLINYVVDIYCSEDEDYVDVTRMNDLQTEVVVYRKDKDSGNKKGLPIYKKIFDNRIADEIRIYLGDDDDKIALYGYVDESPLIRIIGGDGADEIVDSSIVNGYWLNVTPFYDAENKTRVYDEGKKTKIRYGPGTTYNDDKLPEPKDDFERYEPMQRDRGYDWIVNPVLSIGSDDGLIVGGGPMLYKYNFRAIPYEYWMTFTARYATAPNTGSLNYKGIFNSVIKGASINVDAFVTGLTLTRYYGFGNETKFNDEFEDKEFYELEQGVFTFAADFNFSLLRNIDAGLGFTVNYSDHELHQADTLLQGFHDYFGGSYGLNIQKYLEFTSTIKIDTRDNELNARNGFYLNLFSSYSPSMLSMKSPFVFTQFDVRGFITPGDFNLLTIALRAGSGKTFGDYPFYKAQFLGGADNLRGFRRERFSGDAALFAQVELRMFLSNVRIVIPGSLGFHLFSETGRVYVERENSKLWHASYGGGLWLSYLDRMLNLSLTVAHSKEGFRLWAGTKMMF